MSRYVSTKTYDHNEGLSCVFRRWQSTGRDRFLHGYNIQVKLVFEVQGLDEQGYALDFEMLEPIKAFLKDSFSHRVLIAADDPELESFKDLQSKGIIDLRICEGVGLERFGEHIWHHVNGHLNETGLFPRVNIRTVEVREHQGNSHLFLF